MQSRYRPPEFHRTVELIFKAFTKVIGSPLKQTRFAGWIMLCLVIQLNVSCSPKIDAAGKGRFYKSLYLYYFNDSLKVGITLFGDYHIVEPAAYKKQIKSFHRRSFLYRNFKTILFSSKTVVEPFYACTASVGLKNSFAFYDDYGFSPMLIQGNKILRKTRTNKKKVVLEFIIPTDEFDLYLVATGDVKENNNISLKFLEEQIAADLQSILETVKKGAAYDRKSVLNPFDIADDAFDSAPMGNYLLPLKKLEEITPLVSSNETVKDYCLQAQMTHSTFVGDPLTVKKYAALRIGTNKNDSSKDMLSHKIEFDKLQYENAVDVILEQAKDKKVLMFNESHFQPRHRLTVAKMLPQLYDAGYRYVALECISPNDSLINKRKFPILETGFYTREFQMANLVRTAVALGYKIVPYDYQGTNKNPNREYYQAYNLYKNVFRKDPHAKVVVLAGHSHILEQADENNKRWMAWYFRELTRIDPITMNQTDYDFGGEIVNPDLPAGVYIVRDSSATHNNCDLYLTEKYDDSHDEIFIAQKDLKSFDIKIEFTESVTRFKGSKVFQMYLSNELERDSTAVPCFVKAINEASVIAILLPQGKYTYYVKSEPGEVLEKKRMEVTDNGVKLAPY